MAQLAQPAVSGVQVTVIHGERQTVAAAFAEGDDLWLSPEDLPRVSGWELTPEGACLEGVCVPDPPGADSFLARRDGGTWVNLSQVARLIDQPVVASPRRRVWCFGDRPEELASGLASLSAPDFTLPSLDGQLYRLSDFQGRKVLLLTWASW